MLFQLIIWKMKKQQNQLIKQTFQKASTTTISYTKESDESSTIIREIKKTLSTKSEINYDNIYDKNTVIYRTDENDIRYPKVLKSRKEFTIIMEKLGYKPVTFIFKKSVLRILKFLNENFVNGFDKITYAIYSTNETTKIQNITKPFQQNINGINKRGDDDDLQILDRLKKHDKCDDMFECIKNELLPTSNENEKNTKTNCKLKTNLEKATSQIISDNIPYKEKLNKLQHTQSAQLMKNDNIKEIDNQHKINGNINFTKSKTQNEIIDNNTNSNKYLKSLNEPNTTFNQVTTLTNFFQKKEEENIIKRTYQQKLSKDKDININVKDNFSSIPQSPYLTKTSTEYLEPVTWNLYAYEKEIETIQNDPIISICYFPTLNKGKPAIATGHDSGNIYAWDLENNKQLATFLEHKGKVIDIKKIYFTSQFRQIFASISEDTYLKIWDSSCSLKSIKTIQYKTSLVVLDIHPSNYIICADKEKTLYCQKIDFGKKGELINEKQFTKSTTHNKDINTICILDQGSILNTYLVTGSENVMQIHKIDFSKKTFILHKEYPEAHKGIIYDILGITNIQFLTCAEDCLIKVWDITKDMPIRIIDSVCNDIIYSLINIMVADAFVCGSADNMMKIINKKQILSQNEKDYVPKVLYEYKRSEPLYKMIYLKNNDFYSIAAIGNKCSNKVYMWGNNTKPK